MGQETDDYIFGTFWIQEGPWPLVFPRSDAPGFSMKQPAGAQGQSRYVGGWAAWCRSAPWVINIPFALTSLDCHFSFFKPFIRGFGSPLLWLFALFCCRSASCKNWLLLLWFSGWSLLCCFRNITLTARWSPDSIEHWPRALIHQRWAVVSRCDGGRYSGLLWNDLSEVWPRGAAGGG